jgi:hypothetical protein
VAGDQCGGQRIEIGRARKTDIERFESLGGLEQQRRHAVSPAQRPRDLAAQKLQACAVERVERSCLGRGEQLERRFGRTGVVLGLSRSQRPSRAACRRRR